MRNSCLLYYITDRSAFAGDESMRRARLLEKISEAARAGVDYIQLREKDLSTRELESLAHEAMNLIHKLRTENGELRTALLINSRTDVALAVGADGVHLRGDDIAPQEVRAIWLKSDAGRDGVSHFSPPLREVGVSREESHGVTTALASPEQSRRAHPETQSAAAMADPSRLPLIAVSCHSPIDLAEAATHGATFAVFAPVFEKKDSPKAQPTGLNQLREACKAKIPVLALGGITLGNAASCLDAGAAGIAAIRLFQENDIARVTHALRSL